MSERGKLLVLEGQEGAGKTTQLPLTSEHLDALGVEHIVVKEPGFGELNAQIRTMLLDSNNVIDPMTEFALFSADRSNNWRSTIRPALDDGVSVLSDRNWLSSISYQGYGGGIPIDDITRVTRFFTDDRYMDPDLTLVLILKSIEEGMKRAEARGMLDRMEKKGPEYHRKVLEGYMHRSKQIGYTAINGSQTIEAVSSDIKSALETLFSN